MLGWPQNAMYRSQFPHPTYTIKFAYLLGKEYKLAQNGHSLKILRKGPSIIRHNSPIQIGMEEQRQHCSKSNQVVAFHHIEILVVACAVRDANCVQDITAKYCSEDLLDFEDCVAGGIEWQVALYDDGMEVLCRR